MAKLTGLLEAALFVEDLSRARDFFQQVVSLAKIQESEAGCVFVVAKGQLVEAWAEIHRDELQHDWDLLQSGTPVKIDPLR